MSSVTENSKTLAPRVANLSWRVRIALVTIFLIAVATVYFTNQLLTARFTQSTLQRAQLRLALYSGNMVSELQRNSIVPRLLSSDAELVGALMRNSGLKFLCKTVGLTVETHDSAFTVGYSQGTEIQVPIAHHDGNFYATEEELKALESEDRVAFRYSDNPNGSISSIAGVLSTNRRVLGMMPHPERAMDAQMGSADGQALFRALVGQTIHA